MVCLLQGDLAPGMGDRGRRGCPLRYEFSQTHIESRAPARPKGQGKAGSKTASGGLARHFGGILAKNTFIFNACWNRRRNGGGIDAEIDRRFAKMPKHLHRQPMEQADVIEDPETRKAALPGATSQSFQPIKERNDNDEAYHGAPPLAHPKWPTYSRSRLRPPAPASAALTDGAPGFGLALFRFWPGAGSTSSGLVWA
jgi:hypothetical protein